MRWEVSAARPCVWRVVGLRSIREWAMRRDCWGGKPNGEKLAQGILFAPLGVLAGHYG